MRFRCFVAFACALANPLFAADGDVRFVGCPFLLGDVQSGTPIPTAWVVTHQLKANVDATVAAITKDPKNAGKPVIVLNSDTYHDLNPQDHPTLKPTTVVLESATGYIQKNKILAGELHLAGGNCNLCLRNTVQDLLRTFVRSDGQRVTFVAHRSLIYSIYEGPGAPPFIEQLFSTQLRIPHNGMKSLRVKALNKEETRFEIKVDGYPDKTIYVDVVP